MSIARYASYRDSGIDWLGDVPTHWDVAPLKAHYTIVGGATPKSDQDRFWDGDIPWVTPADLSRLETPFISTSIRTITEEGLNSCAASVLPPGSIVLSTRAPIGSLGIAAVPLATNQGCKGLVPKMPTSSGPFLAYVLSVATEQLNVRGKGTTFVELSGDELARFKIAFPPVEEQVAIAAFLDRETGKIDALVEAQRRLIGLLKEKCQAVISHAVTKGLDPAAPMKESGLEWLGQVPAHWRIIPLRTLFRFVKRQDGAEFEVLSVYRDHGVIEKSSRDDNHNVTPADLSNYQTVLKGDLVINKMKAWQGSLGVSALEGITSPDYAVFEPTHSECDDYLHLLLRSRPLPDVYRLISNGIRLSQWRLEPNKFKTLKVPIPPVSEQRDIARRIATAVGMMNALAQEAGKVIATLQERREVLISAAVTGKIDVRQQAEARSAVDQATARRLVGAAVLELVADSPASSRMTSAKRMYLAETHAGVWELRGKPQRMAAGPFDGVLMNEVESELARVGHIKSSQPGGPHSQVHYRLTGQRGALRAELDALLGDRRAAFDKMLADLGGLESRGVEAVATLFAVWNDMLIDGKTPTDDAVMGGVLNDWHAEKRDKFTTADLHNYLGWMRRHGMTPTGRGPRTKSGALL